jgi:hypothetical protein
VSSNGDEGAGVGSWGEPSVYGALRRDHPRSGLLEQFHRPQDEGGQGSRSCPWVVRVVGRVLAVSGEGWLQPSPSASENGKRDGQRGSGVKERRFRRSGADILRGGQGAKGVLVRGSGAAVTRCVIGSELDRRSGASPRG